MFSQQNLAWAPWQASRHLPQRDVLRLAYPAFSVVGRLTELGGRACGEHVDGDVAVPINAEAKMGLPLSAAEGVIPQVPDGVSPVDLDAIP